MNNYPLFLTTVEMRPILILLLLIDVVLRGLSLYKSARKGQNVWFVALLVVNSLGVLPLIYLLIQSDADKKEAGKVTSKKIVKVAPKTKKRSRK